MSSDSKEIGPGEGMRLKRRYEKIGFLKRLFDEKLIPRMKRKSVKKVMIAASRAFGCLRSEDEQDPETVVNTKRNSQTTQEPPDLESRIAQLHKVCALLQEENTRLSRQNQLYVERFSQLANTAATHSSSDLTTALKDHKNSITEARTLQSQLDALRRSYNADIEDLRRKLYHHVSHSAGSNKSGGKVGELQKEVEDLKKKLRDAKEGKRRLEEELSKVCGQEFLRRISGEGQRNVHVQTQGLDDLVAEYVELIHRVSKRIQEDDSGTLAEHMPTLSTLILSCIHHTQHILQKLSHYPTNTTEITRMIIKSIPSPTGVLEIAIFPLEEFVDVVVRICLVEPRALFLFEEVDGEQEGVEVLGERVVIGKVVFPGVGRRVSGERSPDIQKRGVIVSGTGKRASSDRNSDVQKREWHHFLLEYVELTTQLRAILEEDQRRAEQITTLIITCIHHTNHIISYLSDRTTDPPANITETILQSIQTQFPPTVVEKLKFPLAAFVDVLIRICLVEPRVLFVFEKMREGVEVLIEGVVLGKEGRARVVVPGIGRRV